MSERSSESPLPADWQSRDSEAGWYEYLRHCRAEHLAGKPVPSWLRRWREEERREREDAKRQGTLPL